MASSGAGDINLRVDWWRVSGKESAGAAMLRVARDLDERGSTLQRRRQNLKHARLYSNRDLSSIYDYGVIENQYLNGVYLTMNGTQSCVDTIASKIARSKPRGSFLTERGNWTHGTAARKLTQFVDGVYYQNQVYPEGRQAFVDAGLFGTGVLYGSPDVADEAVRVERILPDEVLVDETEAVSGLRSLRNIYRKAWVHKEALLDFWINDLGGSMNDATARLIKGNRGYKPGGGTPPSGAGQMIPVYFGWHLPYRRGGDDGRYCIAIEGAVLHFGPWRMRRFPFSFMHWERPLAGFWGRSLAEQLVPIQLKLNEVLDRIDAAEDYCVPKVFIQKGSLDFDTWNNAFMELIQTNVPPGQAVSVQGVSAVPDQLYRARDHWWKHFFEVTGISTLAAFGEKPAGLTSGAALREVLDRDDLRFTRVGQAWEEFLGQDVPDLVVEVADDLYSTLKDRKKSLTVQVPSDKFARKIDWAKINLERDFFTIRPQPTSTLPTTAGAKKEYALELYNSGALDRTQFLSLLELPDTARQMDLVLSSMETVERHMESILEDGKYMAPEEFAGLELSRAWALQHYLTAQLDGCPDRNLELAIRYIDECTELLETKGAEEQGTAGASSQQGQDGGEMSQDDAAAMVAGPGAGAASTQTPPQTQELVPAAGPGVTAQAGAPVPTTV